MFLRITLCAALACLAGCNDAPPASKSSKAPPASSAPDEDNHDHGPGPNGGTIFDFGKHHAEFTVNHDTKECTILILKGNAKDPQPVACKSMTLITKPTKTKDGKTVPSLTITLTPKDETMGKATKFVGSDAGLGHVAEFSGILTGEVDGKPSSGAFEEK